MRRSLIPHPDSPGSPIARIDAEVLRPNNAGLTLLYRLTGDIAAVRLPHAADAARTDGLWKHTCVEAFLSPGTDGGYTEFNFAPSTQWAAYQFDSYRHAMRPLDLAPPTIAVRASATSLELRVSLALERAAELAQAPAWTLGLSAVIEDATGAISYWALAHPPGRADFHHADGFVLNLPLERT